jgi:hypothetical protein
MGQVGEGSMNGGDAKYGRLYTEKDVRELMAVMAERVAVALKPQSGIALLTADNWRERRIDEMLDAAPLTFPTDEPVFVIRGQDAAAAEAIGHYGDTAHEHGADGEFVRAVFDRADEVELWQKANPDRVGVPD